MRIACRATEFFISEEGIPITEAAPELPLGGGSERAATAMAAAAGGGKKATYIHASLLHVYLQTPVHTPRGRGHPDPPEVEKSEVETGLRIPWVTMVPVGPSPMMDVLADVLALPASPLSGTYYVDTIDGEFRRSGRWEAAEWSEMGWDGIDRRPIRSRGERAMAG